MVKKLIILGILSMLLLTMMPTLSAEQANNGAVLTIYYDLENNEWIVTNIGDEPAYNVECCIKIDCFLIFGGYKKEEIAVLNPSESLIVEECFAIGLGLATETARACADNADPVSHTLEYTLWIFFRIGL